MDLDFDIYKAGEVGVYAKPLIEVFNVKINRNMEVYGTVCVEDAQGTLYLYDTKPTDIKSVESDGILSLTTPPRLIPASGTISFFVDLKDKYGNEFVKGSFCLNLVENNSISLDEMIGQLFEKYQVAHINGKLGSASVYYTLPMVALQACIKVHLMRSNNGYSDVEGTIIGRYGNKYDNSAPEEVKRYSWCMLYKKNSENEPLRLKNEDQLPLSRSKFVAPGRGSVVIEINLKFNHSDHPRESLDRFRIIVPASIFMNGGSHCEEIPLDHCALKVLIYFINPTYLF